MKKTIIYTAFWLATAGIALTSCEDIFGGFLDKQPSNELTEEEVFSQWTTTRVVHILLLRKHYQQITEQIGVVGG